MKYLVTGATGFVGGALARDLMENGHRVVALCRDGDAPDRCQVVRGSLEDMSAVTRAMVEHEVDGVFHLAAQAIVGHARRDPLATMEANVRGTYNLLEAARRVLPKYTPIVVASSDKAYGEMPEGSDRYVEAHPLRGDSPYDVSKSCADLIARSYGLTYGLNVGIVRAGNIYGPGDPDPTRVIPSFLRDLINVRPLTISSDGTPVRDYLYITDAVAAYRKVDDWLRMRSIEVLRPEAFNFAGGEPISVEDLAKQVVVETRVIAKAYGRQEIWLAGQNASRALHWDTAVKDRGYEIKGTRTGDIQRQVLDCTKAWNWLGWSPKISLVVGLEKTILWALRELWPARHG